MSQSKEETPFRHLQEKSKTTVAQSLITGSVAGAMEVLVDHPLWTIKTRLQNGEPFSLKPSVLYTGILANAASMVPITAIQVGLNTAIQNVFFKDGLTDRQRMASAFISGAGSSLVSCPTEMVMLHQGRMKTCFSSAANHIVQQGGYRALFTGMTGTGARDGLFTMSFLALTPILKGYLKPYCKDDAATSIAAGVSAGVLATVPSQVFDTLKTRQQKEVSSKPMGFREAAKHLYATGGMHSFFKGGLPRALRVVSAVTIISGVNAAMEEKFSELNSKPTCKR